MPRSNQQPAAKAGDSPPGKSGYWEDFRRRTFGDVPYAWVRDQAAWIKICATPLSPEQQAADPFADDAGGDA